MPAPTLIANGTANALPVADRTVDAVVTSPPFWKIRGYQDAGAALAGQIGDEADILEWLVAMWEVVAECRRVLRTTGSLFVHLADKYNSDKGGRNYGAGPGTGVMSDAAPYKSLLQLPQRFTEGVIDPAYAAWVAGRAGHPNPEALAAASRMAMRAEIILHRVDSLPESVHDRVRRRHDYLLHFVVDPNGYYADLDPLRTTQLHTDHYQLDTDRYDHTGEKWSESAPAGTRVWQVAQRTLDERGSPPESVWRIVGDKPKIPPLVHIAHLEDRLVPADRAWALAMRHHADGQPLEVRSAAHHTAAYPVELVRRCIEGWTPTGWNADGTPTPRGGTPHRPAVVLDPFIGTGTTTLVASVLGRAGIGVDLSRDYAALAHWRTNDGDQQQRVEARSNKANQQTLV